MTSLIVVAVRIGRCCAMLPVLTHRSWRRFDVSAPRIVQIVAIRNTICGVSMPDNQLANPLLFDLDDTDLSQYKHLDEQYQDWNRVRDICAHIAVDVIHPML